MRDTFVIRHVFYVEYVEKNTGNTFDTINVSFKREKYKLNEKSIGHWFELNVHIAQKLQFSEADPSKFE